MTAQPQEDAFLACGPNTFGLASCVGARFDYGCIYLESRDGGRAMITQDLLLDLAGKVAGLSRDDPGPQIYPKVQA